MIEHPEMVGQEASVQKAIEDPEQIVPSTKTGLAFGFEGKSSAGDIRVMVYYDDPGKFMSGGTTGRVGTAYPISTAYVSRVGAPIYVRPAPTPSAPHPQPAAQPEEDTE